MFENAPTEIPTNAWLLLDALGRSMSDTRLWSANLHIPAVGERGFHRIVNADSRRT